MCCVELLLAVNSIKLGCHWKYKYFSSYELYWKLLHTENRYWSPLWLYGARANWSHVDATFFIGHQIKLWRINAFFFTISIIQPNFVRKMLKLESNGLILWILFNCLTIYFIILSAGEGNLKKDQKEVLNAH